MEAAGGCCAGVALDLEVVKSARLPSVRQSASCQASATALLTPLVPVPSCPSPAAPPACSPPSQALGKAPTFGIRDNRSIKDQRESLPIFKLREQLIQAVHDNQVGGCWVPVACCLCRVVWYCLGVPLQQLEHARWIALRPHALRVPQVQGVIGGAGSRSAADLPTCGLPFSRHRCWW